MQVRKLNRYHEVLELNEHERNHILHLLGKNPEVVDVIASHEPLDISSEDLLVSG